MPAPDPAGYSAKTARETGTENLSKPVISAALAGRRAKISSKLQNTVAAALERLWRMADGDMRGLFNEQGVDG